MRLRHVGSNQTILETETAQVFFSYETPVAAFLYTATENGYSHAGHYVRTDTYYSRTTSKHISQYLAGAKAETVPQSMIDTLLDEQGGVA